jgi:hypothetical protein
MDIEQTAVCSIWSLGETSRDAVSLSAFVDFIIPTCVATIALFEEVSRMCFDVIIIIQGVDSLYLFCPWDCTLSEVNNTILTSGAKCCDCSIKAFGSSYII